MLRRHLSDKATHHNYGKTYDRLLAPYQYKATAVLELGVMHGCSLRAWREYFPGAKIYGIDNDTSRLAGITDLERITLAHGDTTNRDSFLCLCSHLPEFDFICDDCSHVFSEQLFAIAALWPRLKKGGVYIVEDIVKREYLDLFQCFQNAELLDLRIHGGVADDMMVVLRKV